MLLNRLRANDTMEQESVDGLIATTPENTTYLTDHYGDHWIIRTMTVFAVLDLGDSKPILVAPASIVTTTMPTDINLVAYGGIPLVVSEIGTPDEEDKKLLALRNKLDLMPDAMRALCRSIRDLGLEESRIAVDERNFSRTQFEDLADEFPKATFLDGYEIFRKIRAVKTPEEVKRLTESVRATEVGFQKIAETLKVGITERELENVFRAGIAETGAVPLFNVICSGHRSAHTNTIPSDRKIVEGDVVRVDAGARLHFYTSDIARTYVVGEPTDTQNRYWKAIVTGLNAALDSMKPGVTAGQIFATAVNATRAAGLPSFKRHHVGHGIGIEVYDMPILAPDNNTKLEEGMVLCVETPIHELGFSGFQVEDTVVVRPNGVELMSTIPHDLSLHQTSNMDKR